MTPIVIHMVVEQYTRSTKCIVVQSVHVLRVVLWLSNLLLLAHDFMMSATHFTISMWTDTFTITQIYRQTRELHVSMIRIQCAIYAGTNRLATFLCSWCNRFKGFGFTRHYSQWLNFFYNFSINVATLFVVCALKGNVYGERLRLVLL